MSRRHLSLLAAIVLPCAASTAGAQILHEPSTTGATYFVVSAAPGNFTWTVNKIVWGNVPARVAAPKTVERAGAALQAGERKTVSNSVELISPAQSADSSLARWLHAAATAAPSDITITAMNASGTPVARWLLHRAVPTKVQLNQMDAGASQIALTHVTLTAQSVTVLPSGS